MQRLAFKKQKLVRGGVCAGWYGLSPCPGCEEFMAGVADGVFCACEIQSMGQAMFKTWNGFRGPVLGPQSSHVFETCGEAFNV